MSATVIILVQVELILEHAAAAKQLDGNALLPILTVSTPGWLLPDKASQGTFPGTMQNLYQVLQQQRQCNSRQVQQSSLKKRPQGLPSVLQRTDGSCPAR